MLGAVRLQLVKQHISVCGMTPILKMRRLKDREVKQQLFEDTAGDGLMFKCRIHFKARAVACSPWPSAIATQGSTCIHTSSCVNIHTCQVENFHEYIVSIFFVSHLIIMKVLHGNFVYA